MSKINNLTQNQVIITTKLCMCQLKRITLQVYVFGKPEKKEEALEQILNHYKWIESFPTGHELPFFMEEN